MAGTSRCSPLKETTYNRKCRRISRLLQKRRRRCWWARWRRRILSRRGGSAPRCLIFRGLVTLCLRLARGSTLNQPRTVLEDSNETTIWSFFYSNCWCMQFFINHFQISQILWTSMTAHSVGDRHTSPHVNELQNPVDWWMSMSWHWWLGGAAGGGGGMATH